MRFLTLSLLLCASLILPLRAALPSQPNIVLILTDDLGWRDTGWNSDGFIETPNLDRLRQESMSFTQAYACAGNCAPSRACLLSGQYTPRHGVYAVGRTDRGPKNKFRLQPVPNTEYLRPDIVTMAEALKTQGYATGHFGKWHLGSNREGTGPLQQGFDVSESALINPGYGQKQVQEDPKKIFSITTAVTDFITAHKDRPFFTYVAHHAIHSGLQARPETLRHFKEKAAATADPHVSALYAACTFDMDAGVGKLLQSLGDLGLEKNTLVVFTSDNGATPQAINEPLRGAKGAYYEAGIREPFLVRWPGVISPATTCTVPVILLDLYPSFLAAAGGTPPADLDGASLLPLFQDSTASGPSPSLFWHFPGYLDQPVPRGRDPVFRTRPVSVIRKGDWKLFLYHEEWLLDGGYTRLESNHAVELYNLKHDIGEHHDLANQETARRDELLTDLLAWMERTKAPLATVP